MTLYGLLARNDLPWYRFNVTLTGVVYTVRLRFNSRMNRWILDLADPSNNDILVGLPVLIQRNLASQYVITGLPSGPLFCNDNTGQNNQPTQFSFGISHTLYYIDPT